MLLHTILVWLLGSPETAVAEDLSWNAPQGCPDRAALVAGITRRRGRALAPGQVQVEARITAVGPHQHRLEIDLTAGARHESRTVTADTCTALVDAAALLVVLVVDGPAPPEPAPDEATTPATDDAPQVESEAEGVAVDTGAARSGRWLAVVVSAGAAWRVRPRVALWGALMGVAAVHRPSFQRGAPGQVVVLFEPPVASIRLVFGVELRFGDPR